MAEQRPVPETLLDFLLYAPLGGRGHRHGGASPARRSRTGAFRKADRGRGNGGQIRRCRRHAAPEAALHGSPRRLRNSGRLGIGLRSGRPEHLREGFVDASSSGAFVDASSSGGAASGSRFRPAFAVQAQEPASRDCHRQARQGRSRFRRRASHPRLRHAGGLASGREACLAQPRRARVRSQARIGDAAAPYRVAPDRATQRGTGRGRTLSGRRGVR